MSNNIFLYFSRERKECNTSTSTTIKLVEELIIFQRKLAVTSHNATTIKKKKKNFNTSTSTTMKKKKAAKGGYCKLSFHHAIDFPSVKYKFIAHFLPLKFNFHSLFYFII